MADIRSALQALASQVDNSVCVCCGSQSQNYYVVLDFGTFVCAVCSALHRELGHKVKSINLSAFTADEVALLKAQGNRAALHKYFAKYNQISEPRPPQQDKALLKKFISRVFCENAFVEAALVHPTSRIVVHQTQHAPLLPPEQITSRSPTNHPVSFLSPSNIQTDPAADLVSGLSALTFGPTSSLQSPPSKAALIDAPKPTSAAPASSPAFPFYQQPQKPARSSEVSPHASSMEIPRFEAVPIPAPAAVAPSSTPTKPALEPPAVSSPVAVGGPVQIVSGQSPMPAANPMPSVYAFPQPQMIQVPGPQLMQPQMMPMPAPMFQPMMPQMPIVSNVPAGYIMQQTPYGTVLHPTGAMPMQPQMIPAPQMRIVPQQPLVPLGQYSPMPQGQPIFVNPNANFAPHGLSPKVAPRAPAAPAPARANDSDYALALKLQQQFDEESRKSVTSKPNSAYPGSRASSASIPDTSRDEEIARALQQEEESSESD